MIDHNIVRLNISVNNFNNLMAVIQSLKHVNKKQSTEAGFHTFELTFIIMTLFQPNLVLIMVLMVCLVDKVLDTSICVILGYHVEMVFFR
jgi:hypothetical protein